MALSTQHRLALFERLAPIVGEEPMDALLAQFPSTDDDELVTRQFLRAEIAELRTELKGDTAELRTELKGDTAELRTELKGDIAELRTEMTDRFRHQTVWIGSLFVAGMGLSATIASLIP